MSTEKQSWTELKAVKRGSVQEDGNRGLTMDPGSLLNTDGELTTEE